MKQGVTSTLWVWAIGALLVAAGHKELSRADGPDAVPTPERTGVPARLLQTPREAVTVTSPTLMVWRDAATGKVQSSTFPLEAKATVAADPGKDPVHLPATMSRGANTRIIAAVL